MPIGCHWPPRAIRRLIAIGVILVCLSGCGGLEHVRLLRETQNEFSTLAEQEHAQAMRILFPSVEAMGQHLATAVEPAQIWLPGADRIEALVSLHRGYFDLYHRLHALENRAGTRLKADGLAGATATLRVLTHWRLLFYAHILSIEEALPPLVAGQQPTLPRALTEVIADADRLLNDKSLTLYPRDQFMLRALRPLIRYELVYIRLFEADRQQKLPQDTSGIPLITPWVEEIAQAATELAAINEAQYGHMRSYQTLVLFAMLRSAQRLVIQVGLQPAATGQQFPALARAVTDFYTNRASDPVLQRLFKDGLKLQEVFPRMDAQP